MKPTLSALIIFVVSLTCTQCNSTQHIQHPENVVSDFVSVPTLSNAAYITLDSLGCAITTGAWIAGLSSGYLHLINCSNCTFNTDSTLQVKYADFDYENNNITRLEITYYDSRSNFGIYMGHAAQNGQTPLLAVINCGNTKKFVTKIFTIVNFQKGAAYGHDLHINWNFRALPVLQRIVVSE